MRTGRVKGGFARQTPSLDPAGHEVGNAGGYEGLKMMVRSKRQCHLRSKTRKDQADDLDNPPQQSFPGRGQAL